MDENEKKLWGRVKSGSLLENWPKGAAGEPEEPVRLCTCKSVDMSDELKINMLEAYGIPCLRAYPGDGSFGRIILGISGQGVDILVPKSMYEDAAALCNEEGVVEEDE